MCSDQVNNPELIGFIFGTRRLCIYLDWDKHEGQLTVYDVE